VLSGFTVALFADGDAAARENLRRAGFEDIERLGSGPDPDEHGMLFRYDDYHFEARRGGQHCKGGLSLEPGVLSLNAKIHQVCVRAEPSGGP
jgi:hypothetical protein